MWTCVLLFNRYKIKLYYFKDTEKKFTWKKDSHLRKKMGAINMPARFQQIFPECLHYFGWYWGVSFGCAWNRPWNLSESILF